MMLKDKDGQKFFGPNTTSLDNNKHKPFESWEVEIKYFQAMVHGILERFGWARLYISRHHQLPQLYIKFSK